jgi:hypothetical protein
MGMACSMHESEDMYAYTVLIGQANGMRPFGRPTCLWEDNIKMDVKERD